MISIGPVTVKEMSVHASGAAKIFGTTHGRSGWIEFLWREESVTLFLDAPTARKVADLAAKIADDLEAAPVEGIATGEKGGES